MRKRVWFRKCRNCGYVHSVKGTPRARFIKCPRCRHKLYGIWTSGRPVK